MMRVTVAGLGKKHELDLTDADTMRGVKAKLEPLTGLAAAEMKLLVKGKAPDDGATVSGLGLGDGGKMMLMRSQLGAKGAAAADKKPAAAAAPSASGAPAWLVDGARVWYRNAANALEPAVVLAVHTDDPSALYCTITLDGGTERQTSADRLVRRDDAAAVASSSALPPAPPPAAPTTAGESSADAAGEGSVSLTVVQGKRQLTLRCEPSSTVLELKRSLTGLVSADAATMRLLVKGKEATDGAASVESLGLAGGGKCMLLFKERHHRETEGAAVVADCSAQLADLRGAVDKVRHKIAKRLLAGAEAMAALGELEGRADTIAQDLRNAASAGAATLRASHLAELAAIVDDLSEARKAEGHAELMAQLGR